MLLKTKPVVIDDEQVALYHRDGAVLLKNILDPEERQLLEQGVDQAYADPGPRSSIVSPTWATSWKNGETSPSARRSIASSITLESLGAEAIE